MDSPYEIKQRFDNDASHFDTLIVKVVPFYNEMIKALVGAIPHEENAAISVIDLGCGTGEVALRVKKRFPQAQIHCLDAAEKMLHIAKDRLEPYSPITFELGDFTHYQFRQHYDVILSSLALHHLQSDDEQLAFWQRAYDCLSPGGCIFNADVIWGASYYLQSLNIEMWKQFMRRTISDPEIENRWLPQYSTEDRPVQLIKQLKWLDEVGLSDIDVIWKYYGAAVYGGTKK